MMYTRDITHRIQREYVETNCCEPYTTFVDSTLPAEILPEFYATVRIALERILSRAFNHRDYTPDFYSLELVNYSADQFTVRITGDFGDIGDDTLYAISEGIYMELIGNILLNSTIIYTPGMLNVSGSDIPDFIGSTFDDQLVDDPECDPIEEYGVSWVFNYGIYYVRY